MDADRLAKMGEKRREYTSPVSCVGLFDRRRKPGEITNRTQAIRNFCRECMGWVPSVTDEVRRCCAPECWLYPWRNGKVDRDS